MALIDEYKQAIQDVLDGRAKEPPRPSELPWTEDKAATMWAAAAAELIAEDRAGGGGGSGLPDTPGSNGYYTLMNAVLSGTPTVSWVKPLVVTADGPMSSTFKEIRDAFLHGRHVYVSQSMLGNHYASIAAVYQDDDTSVYRVMFHAADGTIVKYAATSLNGYPEYES